MPVAALSEYRNYPLHALAFSLGSRVESKWPSA